MNWPLNIRKAGDQQGSIPAPGYCGTERSDGETSIYIVDEKETFWEPYSIVPSSAGRYWMNFSIVRVILGANISTPIFPSCIFGLLTKTSGLFSVTRICDVLCDLLLFVQFKKSENHPWRSVTFRKLTLPHGCFSLSFKFYKWSQIVQSVSYKRSDDSSILYKTKDSKLLKPCAKNCEMTARVFNVFGL